MSDYSQHYFAPGAVERHKARYRRAGFLRALVRLAALLGTVAIVSASVTLVTLVLVAPSQPQRNEAPSLVTGGQS
jgi:hypothetical protein